jgi:hypothetical protein
MRKLLSIIALCCAMALAFGAYAPSARAGALTSGVLALKGDQANLVEKARYRCWWRHGYRRCGYSYGWRRHRGYGYGYGWRHRLWHNHHGYGWRHRYWRRHYGWRHRYYGGQYSNSSDSNYQTWRDQYYAEHGYYPYRRHYYYNSYSTYTQPTYRRRYAPAGGYCIGLCWW